MKRPNGSGGIRKLAGRRRHPYQVVVSAGREIRDNKVCVKQVSLGCYATRREALEALAEWQTTHLRVDLRHMTFSDIWSKVRPSIAKSQVLYFDTIFKYYEPLHDIRLVDIRTQTLESVSLPTLSVSAQNKVKTFWRRIFEYGLENDIVNKDYSQFIRFDTTTPKRKKEILSPAEITKCMDKKLYRILLYTGMRINELLEMKTSQIYEDNGVMCFHITKSKTSAGIRTIPVHSKILKDIDTSTEYVIEPHKNYQTRKFEFYRYGCGEHTLHDFRRTFASYAMSCGVEEYYAKCLMGHAHNDITQDVYTQAFIKDLKREIEKINYDTNR